MHKPQSEDVRINTRLPDVDGHRNPNTPVTTGGASDATMEYKQRMKEV
jgi:hypothetical protein